MPSWPLDPATDVPVLVGSLLTIVVPTLIGTTRGASAASAASASRRAIAALGGVALTLTLLGLWLWMLGRTPGASLDAVVSDLLFGFFLSFAGVLVGFYGCGAALANAGREKRGRWLVALLLAAFLPLLATVALFVYVPLVAFRLYPGTPEAGLAQDRILMAAPIGAIALIIYGASALLPARARARS